MACSPESVKLSSEDAAQTTSSLPPPPPPPPPPPLYLPWLQPPYPSAPPPNYGDAAISKAYEASNVTGPYPYPYTANLANPPHHQMFLSPNPQTSSERGQQAQQVVFIERPDGLRSGQSQQSFLAHFVLSCFIFWCCGWLCGGIAFIVAIMAQNSASSGDVAGARRLGNVSLGLSICGFVVGTVTTIVIIVQAMQKGKY